MEKKLAGEKWPHIFYLPFFCLSSAVLVNTVWRLTCAVMAVLTQTVAMFVKLHLRLVENKTGKTRQA